MCFVNGSALALTAGPFSTSVAVVIVATVIAVIVAARKLADSNAVKPIASISRVRMARPTTAIGSANTGNVGLEKKA